MQPMNSYVIARICDIIAKNVGGLDDNHHILHTDTRLYVYDYEDAIILYLIYDFRNDNMRITLNIAGNEQGHHEHYCKLDKLFEWLDSTIAGAYPLSKNS